MGLPSKTLWSVALFAALGAASLAALRFWSSADPSQPGVEDVEIAALTTPGPLPIPLGPTLNPSAEPEPDLASGQQRRIEQPHQAVADPTGKALCGFYGALEGLRTDVRHTVRAAHYGDSILTSDHLSGQIRRVLQNWFGDAGHGFVLLGKPWRWYRHEDVRHGVKGDWRVRPLTSHPIPDGLYGLGGVASEPKRGSRTAAWVATNDKGEHGSRVASFDLSYLKQPSGGSFDVRINGVVVDTVHTASEERRAAHHMVHVNPPGEARLTVEPRNDGLIRLFGVALESDQQGIVWDSLAINGARASVLARNDAVHWQAELAHRNSDLIVLMFGANEGHNNFLDLSDYRVNLTNVIRLMRGGVPDASFLLVGPLDQARRLADGTFDSRRMPVKLNEAQREVALAEGCAFFDTYEAMGGRKSMGRWFRRGLGGGDFIHPTEHGSRKIGNWIAEALIYGFQEYRENPTMCEASIASDLREECTH